MPTLRFADDFNSTERKILMRTFHQNCRDLGITKRDASIDVRRHYMPNPATLGCISHIEEDRFLIFLNTQNDLMRSIFAIGHELIHFEQHVRGDMFDDHIVGGTFWKGKFFPASITQSKEHYDELPWEIEAAERHEELFDSAMHCLPHHERAVVCDRSLAA